MTRLFHHTPTPWLTLLLVLGKSCVRVNQGLGVLSKWVAIQIFNVTATLVAGKGKRRKKEIQ